MGLDLVCGVLTKPLLPAIDAAGQLREVAFALLLRDRRPVEVRELADATGLGVDATAVSVETLATAGWLDLDESGRIAGAAGLSLVSGPHTLILGGAAFRTWCAYDAIGIAAALDADADIRTTCGQCGLAISLAFHHGAPERSGPERLWLADGGPDLRGSFCTPTVLLCGDEHTAAWAAVQRGHGHRLDLAAAASQGAGEWAGCAMAARRLA